MASPVIPTVSVPVVRGDKLTQAFTLRLEGFDFTGASIVAQTRETPDGDLLAEPTITVDTSIEGRAICVLTISDEDTGEFPDRCMTEVEVSKEGWELGPLTVLRLQHALEKDYRHD